MLSIYIHTPSCENRIYYSIIFWFLLSTVSGIKVPTESFESIDPGDSKYKNVRVILVTANCSRSGVTNPVDFIVNEGEGKTLTAINNINNKKKKQQEIQA